MEKVKVNLFISVVVNIVYSLFVAMTLSGKIATHFKLNGIADGYQSPMFFVIFQIVLCILIAILFMLLPWILKTIPIKYINIPNRGKWLTGEERDKSLKKLSFMLLLLGTVIIYFLTSMSMVIYIANISTPLMLPILPFVILLLIFFTFLITWIVKLYKLFP